MFTGLIDLATSQSHDHLESLAYLDREKARGGRFERGSVALSIYVSPKQVLSQTAATRGAAGSGFATPTDVPARARRIDDADPVGRDGSGGELLSHRDWALFFLSRGKSAGRKKGEVSFCLQGRRGWGRRG